MTLKGKKCPRPGVLVQTKGGLVGTTTGDCGKRNAPVVAVAGVGAAPFKRGELKAVPKRQATKLADELKRLKSAPGPGPGPAQVFDWNDPSKVRMHRPRAAASIDWDAQYNAPVDGLGGLGASSQNEHIAQLDEAQQIYMRAAGLLSRTVSSPAPDCDDALRFFRDMTDYYTRSLVHMREAFPGSETMPAEAPGSREAVAMFKQKCLVAPKSSAWSNLKARFRKK